MLTGRFERGKNGFICRYPSDRQAWVIPAQGSITPTVGVMYVLKISGQTQRGNLRFAHLSEMREVYQPIWRAIQAALEQPELFSVRYLGEGGYAIIVRLPQKAYSLKFLVSQDRVEIDRYWEHCEEDFVTTFEVTNAVRSKLPEAYQAWVASMAEWAAIKAAKEAAVIRGGNMKVFPFKTPTNWAEISPERLATAHDGSLTLEEVAQAAAQEGSENGPLGQWPQARLERSPEAGDIVWLDGNWYVAVAGVRREGYKGNYGGLYARWVQVPKGVCQGWEP